MSLNSLVELMTIAGFYLRKLQVLGSGYDSIYC